MFSRSYASIEAVGRIGKDAVLRTTKSGHSYATFSVAVTEKVGTETTTQWYDVSYFCDQKFAEWLKAGTLVLVHGEPVVKATTVKGQPKAYLGIRGRELTILAYPQKERPSAAPAATDQGMPYDDIPADRVIDEADVPF